jgi:rod shape-determining protein MreD
MRNGGGLPILRQLIFLGLGVAAIYLPLTPIAPGADQVAPDALFCVAVAWVLRDPAAAPVLLVLALGVFADVMLSRPPGLGALGLLFATELARTRRELLRGTPILVEWLVVVMVYAFIVAVTHAVLRLSFADSPAPALMLRLVGETALLYVIVSLALALGLRLFGPRGPHFRDPAAESLP